METHTNSFNGRSVPVTLNDLLKFGIPARILVGLIHLSIPTALNADRKGGGDHG